MSKKALVGAGIVGLAAYLYYREYYLPRSVVPAGGQPLAPPRQTDFSKVYLDYCVQGADTLLADRGAGGFILSDYMPDAINVQAEIAQLGNGQSDYGHTLGSVMWAFYHQIYLPASRVKDADIQPYHFQLANGILSGLITRNDKLGRLYTQLVADVAQNKANADQLAAASTAITVIGAVIPVVGGVAALAANTGIKQGIAGDQANIAQDLNAVNTAATIKAGLGVGSPEGRAWLKNDQGGSERPIDGQYVHADNGIAVPICSIGLTELGGFYYNASDGSPVGQAEATQVTRSTINGVTADRSSIKPGYGWQSVVCRMRLFSMYQYGWILPWLSEQLGAGQGVAKQIAIIAPTLRAFDRMMCSSNPVPPPGGKGDPDRYWYISPLYGNCYGSIFPPDRSAGDVDIGFSHGDGTYYGSHGEDNTAGHNALIKAATTLVDPNAGHKAVIASASTLVVPGAETTSNDASQQAPAEDYGQAAGQQAARSAIASSYIGGYR